MQHQDRAGSADDAREVVLVGLVATPPDHPAEVLERLAGELSKLLSARADRSVRWEVRTGWGAVAPRRDGGVEALLEDVAQRREGEGWDVAVCLTDLPLSVERVPLVAHASARRRVGVVSLPALGVGQLRAARAAVPGLVEGLAGGWSETPGASRDERLGRMVEAVAPIHRVVDRTDDGEVGFVASRVGGRLLVGAFGTAAFALTTSTIWDIGDALDGLRLTVIMLLSLAALITWLVVAHDLWEKPSADTPRELARMFNAGTLVTLGLATAACYLVLFIGTAAAAALLIDPSVLGHPAPPGHRRRLHHPRLDHQLDGDHRWRDRVRARGRGARACRGVRLPPHPGRLAGRGRRRGRPLTAPELSPSGGGWPRGARRSASGTSGRSVRCGRNPTAARRR